MSRPSPAPVLVTGAAGFLGRYVTRKLVERNIPVRCAVQPGTSARAKVALADFAPAADIVEGSLANPADCRTLLTGCDAVIHLAARGAGATSQLFVSNVTATKRLVNAACEHGVRRFVHISSIAVYAAPASIRPRIDEAAPIESRPELRDAYTFSKVIQEKVVWDAFQQRSLPLVIVRPGVIFGPGRSYITPRLGLALGKTLCVMGMRRRLPYTFVENCADAVVRALVEPNLEGQAFNIIDDELPTSHALARRYRDATPGARTVTVPGVGVVALAWLVERCADATRGLVPQAVTPYRARALWCRASYPNSNAKRHLKWTPGVALGEALDATERLS